MPSKSKKQAKLMRAVAHGWKPSRIKGPTRAVAKEFVSADKRRDEVTGYQFGGGVPSGMYGNMMNRFGGQSPYRGVPPQRGALSAGRQGMAAPWQGRGPSPMGGGRPGGGGWREAIQRGRQPGGPGGGRAGALRQMMQRMQSGGGGAGPGPGGGFLSRFRQQAEQQRGQQPGGGVMGPEQLDMQLPPFNRTPSGEIDLGGGRTPEWGPGMPGRVGTLGGPGRGPDPLGSAGPGGSLRGPGRFPGAGGPAGRMGRAQSRFGALTQGAPGGGSFGKPMPGRRIAPPPGRYPGGGNPMTGGRNPLIRGAGRRGGRGGRGGRGMYR